MREVQAAQLLRLEPSQLVVLVLRQVRRLAVPGGDDPDVLDHPLGEVRPALDVERRWAGDRCLDAELLPQLADERVDRLLARLDVAARQGPAVGVVAPIGTPLVTR